MVIRVRQLRPSSLAGWLWLGLLAAARLPAAGQAAPQPKMDSLKRALTMTTDTARVKMLQLLSHVAINDCLEAMAYAQQGLAESKRLGWKPGQAQSLEDIGRLYWRQGNFTQAQQYLLRALTLWRALHRERQRLRATLFISELLGATKQFAKALEWEKQVFTGARASHDTLLLAHAYAGMGVLYGQQQQFAASVPYYQQALVLAEQLRKNKNPDFNLIDQVTSLTLNNLADANIELNQPRIAIPYLLRSLKMEQRLHNAYKITVVQITLAQAYLKLGKWDMVAYHALQARQLSSASNNVPKLILSNDLLDTLYAQQGNYRLARRYLAENRALETKARIQGQERQIAEAQGRYDTKEKERNIKLLTQQNQIEQLATLQQRTLRDAALVIALLLLLAVSILFNRYRLRQRTVRLLDEQNQEKELLLREKTLLLQEVHHRVKNNLQIVLSLLNNQLDTLLDPGAAAAIRESQSRVQTMALIHQNLYQSESLARIDMRRYLAELLDAIGQAFRREEVAVALDVAPVHLTTHTAVPLGLIVNELVTNAYKYAFAGRTANQLHVELSQPRSGTYRLVVADNGVGLPPINLDVVQSLGLRLTAGLLRQMHAQFTISRAPGTRFTITFRELLGADFESAGQLAAATSTI